MLKLARRYLLFSIALLFLAIGSGYVQTKASPAQTSEAKSSLNSTSLVLPTLINPNNAPVDASQPRNLLNNQARVYPHHTLPGNVPLANSPGLPSSLAPANYDEQIGMTFTQSFSSMAWNVTAVAQSDTNGYGPAYLLNGLSTAGYWYQVGISYDWPYAAGGYNPGFHLSYNVFDSTGHVVLPSNGGG